MLRNTALTLALALALCAMLGVSAENNATAAVVAEESEAVCAGVRRLFAISALPATPADLEAEERAGDPAAWSTAESFEAVVAHRVLVVRVR